MERAPADTSELIAAATAPEQYLDATAPRGRLLLAMTQSIIERGFTNTMVNDVVRIARVSKRTFYEHFADREDCFLALCDASADWKIALTDRAADPDLPWREQLARAVDVFIAGMTAAPPLTRAFLYEVYSAGERGARQQRDISRRFAEQICALVERIRLDNPELNPVSLAKASALVAGVSELAMVTVESESSTAEEDFRIEVIQLLSDALTAPRL
ncbi:MAG: TetR/AcrR family transcriptional regulator [Solirubrobacterales bacterium]